MRMFTVSRAIAAPRSEVYGILAAVDRTPEWASSVEKVELLDPGPIGNGTRFRETRRHHEHASTAEMTVGDLVPDERIEIVSVQADVLFVSTWNLESSADGTVVHFEMDFTAERLKTRIVAWFVARAMRGVMRGCIEDDLDDLERFLEQGGDR